MENTVLIYPMFVYVTWHNAEYNSFGITVERVHKTPRHLPAAVYEHLS
jgi:hypothetical protein